MSHEALLKIQSPKQVLVWRKDLRNSDGHKVRSGKVAAQLAHASMAALLCAGQMHRDHDDDNEPLDHLFMLRAAPNSALALWLEGSFTKICVYVNSEQELLDVYNKARGAKLISALIVDNGLTEFDGVKTTTCCAIGPAFPDQLVGITDHLPLF